MKKIIFYGAGDISKALIERFCAIARYLSPWTNCIEHNLTTTAMAKTNIQPATKYNLFNMLVSVTAKT